VDVTGSRALRWTAVLAALGAANWGCDWEELEALVPLEGDAQLEDASGVAADAPEASGDSDDDSDSARFFADGDAQRQDSTSASDVTGAADVSDSAPGETSASAAACATANAAAVTQWTFDTTIEGWTLLDGSVGATLAWADAGDPSPGALEVDGTATEVDAATTTPAYVVLNESPSVDLSGRTVSAWLWLDSGSSPSIKLFVQTGSLYVWADGGSVALVPRMWTCISLNVSVPAYSSQDGVYDPTSVVRIGFELDQSAPYRLYVDSVGY
jgi:hypothetical protein